MSVHDLVNVAKCERLDRAVMTFDAIRRVRGETVLLASNFCERQRLALQRKIRMYSQHETQTQVLNSTGPFTQRHEREIEIEIERVSKACVGIRGARALFTHIHT